MTTALYLIMCKDLGLSLDELDQITEGMVWDMVIEKGNDQYEYPMIAGQQQYNDFLGG